MQQQLSQLIALGRHLVVLSVPWSGPALVSARTAKSCEAGLAALGVTLTILDEDDPAVRNWLVELKVRTSTDYAVGAGSYLWFSHGLLQRFTQTGSSARDIISTARTLSGEAA